jgi:hypothetical protein
MTAGFARLAGACALLVAAASLGYAVSFLIVRPESPDSGGAAASAFLLAGGLLALPALLAGRGERPVVEAATVARDEIRA